MSLLFRLRSSQRMPFKSALPQIKLLRRQQLSSHSTPLTSYQAIDSIEQSNSTLNAFVSYRTKDDISKSEPQNGPLKGWPVGIKANIAMTTASTTCASKVLEGYTSPFKATAVEALEKAGAVIVGKTNMDEFGMGSKNLYSKYGPARNPFRPDDTVGTENYDYSPGGSSGGSGAAVAAGMCRVALGSDTGGSVRLPGAWCGIVGYKPTYGRISRYGLVPYGSSLDTVGIMARTVEDVHSTFKAICIPDHRDMTCMSESLRKRINDMAKSRPWVNKLYEVSPGQSLKIKQPLKGMRIGIPRECWVEELSEPALESWKAGARRLADLGCEIVAVSLPHLPYSLPTYYTIALAEASSNLARYDGIRYGWRSSEKPDDLHNCNASNKYANTRSEGFGIEVQRRILLGTYVLSAQTCEQYYIPSQKIRRLIQQDFDSVFALPNALHAESASAKSRLLTRRPAGVDALLFPTSTNTARLLESKGKNQAAGYVNDVMTVPANLAGIPAISVPAGEKNGMPLGLQLSAQYGDDELLLQIASHLQQ